MCVATAFHTFDSAFHFLKTKMSDSFSDDDEDEDNLPEIDKCMNKIILECLETQNSDDETSDDEAKSDYDPWIRVKLKWYFLAQLMKIKEQIGKSNNEVALCYVSFAINYIKMNINE